MSAENSADHDAEGGGGDLRARYLPVSRKELRRRREAELVAQREAQEQADAAADELAENQDFPGEHAESDAEPAAPMGEEPSEGEDQPEPPRDTGPPQDDDEPVTQLISAVSADADDEPGADEDPRADSPAEGPENEEEGSADQRDPEEESSAAHPSEPTGPLSGLRFPAPPREDPEPEDSEGTPEDPEETTAVGLAAVTPEQSRSEEPDTDTEPGQDAAGGEGPDQEDLGAEKIETDGSGAEPAGDAPAEAGLLGLESPDDGDEEDEEAPVPASRRSRRLLRETGRLEALTDERLSEIDEITRQAAQVSAEDPNRVDPELLKKQQALAAKAMQENQERRRREQEEAEREQRHRRRQRPESEVITRKALRAYTEADEEYRDVATGEIDPVEARVAHGLELDEMVELTSRQASRQSLMLWLVIVLAVLLLLAVGLGLVFYFVL